MNMSSQLVVERAKIENRKREKISGAIWFLFVGLVFCFSNNHNALLIADYCAFLIFFVACMLMKRRFVIPLHPLMLSMVILLAFSVVFLPLLDRGTLLSYLVWIPVMILAVSYRFNKKEIDTLMWGFILGAVIMSVLVIVQKHHYYEPESYRFSIQIWNHEEIDPNYLAAFLYVGTIFAAHMALHRSRRDLKFVVIMFLGIILYAITMTGSRAAVLGIGIAFCGVMLRIFKARKNAVILFAVTILGALLLILVSANMASEVMSRFDFRTLLDTSNMRRLEHWYAAVRCIIQRPLFGYGAAKTLDILTEYAGHRGDAHNTLLTLLLHFGLVGSIPILSLLWKIFDKFRKIQNKDWLFYFFGFLFINLIIANHLGISFWLPIMIFYQIRNREEFQKC